MKVQYLFLNILVGFASSSSATRDCTSAKDYLKSRREAYRCRVKAMVGGGTSASRCASLACQVPPAYQHLVPKTSAGVAPLPDPTLFATTIAIALMVYSYAGPLMPWLLVLASQFKKLKGESVTDLRVKKLGDQVASLNDQVQSLSSIERKLEGVVDTMSTLMTGVTAVKQDANRRADAQDQKTIQLQVDHGRQQLVLQELRAYLLELEDSIKEKVAHLNTTTAIKMHELQKKTNATTTKAIVEASKGNVKRVPLSVWEVVTTVSLAIIALCAIVATVFFLWLYWPGPNPPNYNQAVAYNGNNVEMMGVGGGAQ